MILPGGVDFNADELFPHGVQRILHTAKSSVRVFHTLIAEPSRLFSPTKPQLAAVALWAQVLIVLLIIAGASLAVVWLSATKMNSTTSQKTNGGIDTCAPFTDKMNGANLLTMKRSPSGAYYDTQFWLGLTKNFSQISVNVTTLAQNDTHGFGPAYLLNGLSDTGYWYQVGVSWNWGENNSTTHRSGFRFDWELFDVATNKSILPYGGGLGIGNFSGIVKSGDVVTLSLSIGKNYINASAFDINSTAKDSVPLPKYNSTIFTGSDNSGTIYPTSFLTEWYHFLPYFCSPLQVRFSNSLNESAISWAKIDEWNFTGIPPSQWFNASDSKQILFESRTWPSIWSVSFSYLGTNGTRVYANPTTFITP